MARAVLAPSGARLIATEHQEQVAVIQWADTAGWRYPELRWLFAIPNGGFRVAGVGGQLKAEGVRPGVPDLMLPVARGGYHGAFVEMKRELGRATPDQIKWAEYVKAAGYAYCLAQGFKPARDFLLAYLDARLISADAQRAQ